MLAATVDGEQVMKAVLCVEYGPPEKLVVADVAVPEPARGQVRISVKAVGVNFPDTLIIQNLYQFKPALPFSPGGECAGIVSAIGEGITDIAVGESVIAMTGHGGMAAEVIANRGQVVKMASGMPFDIAAGFTMTYGTSHHALKQRANLQPGETLLVLGAAGGVGLTAVELGQVMGARVIALDTSADRLARARDFGAAEIINPAEIPDVVAAIRDLTHGRGAHASLDASSSPQARAQAVRCVRSWGKACFVGEGDTVTLDVSNDMLRRQVTILGSWTFSTVGQAECARYIADRGVAVDRLFTHRWTLEQAEEAYRLFDGQSSGKGVILPA
jgi:NADPH:quinone reductase-like Zn-dependent oxidoreductase